MKTFKSNSDGLCNMLCQFLKFYYHNFKDDIRLKISNELISNNVIKNKTITNFKLKKYDDSWLFMIWFIKNNELKLYKIGLHSLDINKNILNYVSEFSKNFFDDDTISVHIRTWNSSTNKKTNTNKAKRRNKKFNIDSYIHHMKKFEDKKFYVSMDNNKYNKLLTEQFKHNIIFYKINNELSRLQNDMASLLLLSKNTIFIASYKSTYSQIAYLYNNNLKTLIYGNTINESISTPNPVK